MKIETGKGNISLIMLIAIWSISLQVNLPGVAVSPILGKLSAVFPSASHLEIQLLTSLPCLMMAIFILLSGKLYQRINYIYLLRTGLIIFLVSGVLFFFANKMVELLFLSVSIGIGAGLIIPLSTGLIAHYFFAQYRVQQFGYCSSISNFATVFATLATGYLAEISWHFPFLIYLLPIVSLILSFALIQKKKINRTIKKYTPSPIHKNEIDPAKYGKDGMNLKQIGHILLFYGLLTFLLLMVVFNISFIVEDAKLSSGYSGTMIAIFYFAVTMPGLFINIILIRLKANTVFYSLIICGIGLASIFFFHHVISLYAGCFLAGLGFGILTPLIYDKTAQSTSQKKSVLGLALVMAINSRPLKNRFFHLGDF